MPGIPTTTSPLSAPFYVVSGTLPLDSQSYVARQADKDLLTALLAGEYCFVLNSRQMGKSSLAVRTTAKLQEAGVKTVFLDLTKIGGSNVTPEQWYIGLLSETGRALGLRKEFLEYWKENSEYSLIQRYIGALHDVALTQISSPLVLFVDEIDAVKSLSFSTDEFFAAIRECYNRRVQEPEYGRLAFALVGSATASDLIQDTRTSPFNIGKRIELKDFTLQEALPLGEGWISPGNAAKEGETRRGGEGVKRLLERVYYWTNGHPFLTQALCSEIAAYLTPQPPSPRGRGSNSPLPRREGVGGRLVDGVVASVFFEAKARERNVNLADVSNRILSSYLDAGRKEEHRAAILDLYGKVWSKRVKVADDETNRLVAVLKLSGITTSVQGELRVRNRIYERVFDKAWIEQNMPDAELRRQRHAFQRGLTLAGAVSAVVLAAISSLAVAAYRGWRQAGANETRASTAARLAKRSEASAIAASFRAAASAKRAGEEKSRADSKAHLADIKTKEAENKTKEARQNLLLAKHNGELALARERDANRAKLSEAAQRETTAQQLYGADMQLAGQLWRAGNIGRVKELLDRHRPNANDPVDRRGLDWRYQWTLLNSAPALLGHNGAVIGGAFAPNGDMLTLDEDNYLRRWDGQSHRQVIQNDNFAVMKLLSPDGKTLAVRRYYSKVSVTLLDIGTGKERYLPLRRESGIYPLVFSSNSRWLAVVGLITRGAAIDRSVTVWDVQTGAEVHHMSDFPDARGTLALSPDGNMLASVSNDNDFLRLYDLHMPKATPLQFYGKASVATIMTVAFSKSGAQIASGDYIGNVIVWNTANRSLEHQLSSTHISVAQKVVFAPNGATLALGSEDGMVQIWDVRNERPLRTIGAHTAPISMLAFNADGSQLATGDTGGTAKLWDLRSAPGERFLPADASGAAASPDGRLLATANRRGVTLWDTRTWKELGTLDPGGGAFGVAFSPDSRLLAVAGEDKRITIWDIVSKRLLHDYSDLATSTTSQGLGEVTVAYSPDGRFVAAGDGIGEIFGGINGQYELKIWDTDKGALVASRRHLGGITSLAFSANGEWLASGGQDNRVNLWHTEDWRLVRSFNGPDTFVFSVAFAPDSRSMAVGGRDGSILLVDPENPASRTLLHGHTNIVWALAYTPDGKTLVSASHDRTLRCWDVSSMRETQQLTGHTLPLQFCTLTRGARGIVSGSYNGEVIVNEAVPLHEADARDRVAAPYQMAATLRHQIGPAQQAKDWPKVAELAGPLLQRSPDSDYLLYWHAYALSETGHYGGAAAEWLRLAQLRKWSAAYLYCAYAKLGAGDKEGYLRLRTDIMERYAKSAVADDAMRFAQICALNPDTLRDIGSALKLAQLGLAYPNATIPKGIYGMLLYRAGRYDEAVQELTKAVDGTANTALFQLHLAEARWMTGNHLEARHTLRAAQEVHRAGGTAWTWDDKLDWNLFSGEAERLIK